MIRITVELIPYGDESAAKKIGEMVIANAGDGSGEFGDYAAWVSGNDWTGEPPKYGYFRGHDRKQSVWELIMLMLEVIRHENWVPDTEEDSLAQRLFRRLGGSCDKKSSAPPDTQRSNSTKSNSEYSEALSADNTNKS